MNISKLGVAATLLIASGASGYPNILDELETETGLVDLGCGTCHRNAEGGRGCGSPPCLDAFGRDVQRERRLVITHDRFMVLMEDLGEILMTHLGHDPAKLRQIAHEFAKLVRRLREQGGG